MLLHNLCGVVVDKLYLSLFMNYNAKVGFNVSDCCFQPKRKNVTIITTSGGRLYILMPIDRINL